MGTNRYCHTDNCRRNVTSQKSTTGRPIRRSVTALVLMVLMIIAASTPAQDNGHGDRVVPEIRATRINPHPPRIDGNLDDPIWQSDAVEIVRNFTQREPDDGQPATESTLVAVAYDDDALYVAYWCYDSEIEKVDPQLMRRDRLGTTDYIVLRIDPFHDHQSGYQFSLNPVGVQTDARLYNDDWQDFSWDAVWEGTSKIHSWGWGAEFRIPYTCLRFLEKEEHTWGVEFSRLIHRKNESIRWSYVPSGTSGLCSHFGHLTGLRGIVPARHLEVLPYAISSLETEPKSLGNDDGRRMIGDAGVDVKYGITSNLTLDLTVNPDFGQVELDQPVLNLSTYETVYGERRPFFLEGNDLFNTDFSLFYSRRIGRPPHGSVNDPEGAYYTDYPSETTILGAAKLTGKLSGKTSIAILGALTDEEKATYMTTGGEERKGVVEPMAGYTAVRVKQDVLRNSYVGGILTVASQETMLPATTGGFDWRLFTNNNMWATTGQVVFSRLGPDDVGYGMTADIRKESGDHLQGAVNIVLKDRKFNPNRLGYTRRNDYKELSTWWQYRTRDDWWIVRNSWNNVNVNAAWNYDGNNIDYSFNFNNWVEFTNRWGAGVSITRYMPKYDDRETRGYGLWEVPNDWWRVNLSLETDSRKKVYFGYYPQFGHYREASWWAHQLNVTYRPTPTMTFSANARYSKDYGQRYWLYNASGLTDPDVWTSDDSVSTLFANLNQDVITFGFSSSLMIHRNLSIQFSAEGLISGLDYYDYRPYYGGGTYGRLVNDTELFGPGNEGYGAFDYNWSALNSTLLIRWEYNPGSTVYLVWTRSRPEYDPTANDVDLGRDFDRFISRGSSNVFLVKISHWMNI